MINEIMRKNIISNMTQTMNFSVNLSKHRNAFVKNENGSMIYFSGSDFPIFNGIMNNIQDNLDNINKNNFKEKIEFFLQRKKPFTWWWLQPNNIPDNLQQELNVLKFQPMGEYLGIACKLDQVQFITLPNNIQIKEVINEEDYKKMIDITSTVFQFSDSIKQDISSMFNSYGPHSKLRHYLGLYEGEAASTLTTYTNEGIVGFYNGSTLPHFRKHGLCTALIQYATHNALQSGCKYGVAQLMDDAMAKNLCEQIGFKTYCRMLPYMFL